MQTGQKRFLPKAVAAEVRRLPWRLLGLSVFAVALALWVALLSWSYTDPSLNYATPARPRNIFGYYGAAGADILFQAFGLAAPLLVLPLAALGLHIGRGIVPLRLPGRAMAFVAASLLLPAFMGCIPAPPSWLLDHGLGGIAGEAVDRAVARLAADVPDAILWPPAALLFAALGLAALLVACGPAVRTLQPASNAGGKIAANAAGSAASKPVARSRYTFRHRFTSWTQRLPSRTRALTATRSRPREFWMSAASPIEPEGLPPVTRKQPPSPTLHRNGELLAGARFGPRRSRRDDRADADGPVAFQPERDPKSRGGESGDEARIEPFFGPVTEDDPPGLGSGAEPGSNRDTAQPANRLTSRAAKRPDVQSSGLFGRLDTFRIDANANRGPRDSAKPQCSGRNGGTDGAKPFAPSLPPASMLASPAAGHASETRAPSGAYLAKRAVLLMDVLADFGIQGRITDIHPGPVITLFVLKPARGTKSSRVVGLAGDIARSMSAPSARVAPIPGQDAIGIELPNPHRETVGLRAILESSAFQNTQAALPLALGTSIGGEAVCVDLARMPHLLIAGTTGSGKSVAINTMILSLLYRLTPAQCNFIMIDPKMLELSAYRDIPHLLAPVVTDPKKAVAALNWTVREMNERYERMCKLGVRNIASYNAKAASAALRGEKLRRSIRTGFDPSTHEPIEEEEVFDPLPLPYLVVVIDEMADLMMAGGKDVEHAVQRLSQMARAAGIHLIVATQRPSVDVITGTIKANFPSRIGFQVSSKIDSRTIIGEQGAEQLLGAGDMLYVAAGGRTMRVHGPFVSDGEVEAVTAYLKAQGAPAYREGIVDGPAIGSDAEGLQKRDSGTSGDLYAEAVDIVLRDRKPTTSYLQRRLGIGYNRAAALIERMERDGIVGAPNRTGRREILSDDVAELAASH